LRILISMSPLPESMIPRACNTGSTRGGVGGGSNVSESVDHLQAHCRSDLGWTGRDWIKLDQTLLDRAPQRQPERSCAEPHGVPTFHSFILEATRRSQRSILRFGRCSECTDSDVARYGARCYASPHVD
jgi:hypothetical protein